MLANVSMLIGLGLSFTRGMDGRTLRDRRGRARKISLAEISIEIARLVLSMTGHTKGPRFSACTKFDFISVLLGPEPKELPGRAWSRERSEPKGLPGRSRSNEQPTSLVVSRGPEPGG